MHGGRERRHVLAGDPFGTARADRIEVRCREHLADEPVAPEVGVGRGLTEGDDVSDGGAVPEVHQDAAAHLEGLQVRGNEVIERALERTGGDVDDDLCRLHARDDST